MIYRVQKGFQNFKCIADKCPKSCCIGWQIVIDDESIDKYKSLEDDYAIKINVAIDYQQESFKQDKSGRCSMLLDNGLCDLQCNKGHDFLCTTCKLYPRHIEEFPDIREYSLSMSCPEVARIILDTGYDFIIEESSDDIIDSEDYEDFDDLIFDRLEFARDKMIDIAKDRSLPLQKRLEIISSVALFIQRKYDNGQIFEMDQFKNEVQDTINGVILDYDYCMKGLSYLINMEVLELSWTESIIKAKEYWQDKSKVEWMQVMFPDAKLELAFEKIFEVLFFTYFCGAIYDGQIYARTMIAVQSVRWLIMLNEADKTKDLREILYLYSREIEHSDININRLIDYFEGEL